MSTIQELLAKAVKLGNSKCEYLYIDRLRNGDTVISGVIPDTHIFHVYGKPKGLSPGRIIISFKLARLLARSKKLHIYTDRVKADNAYIPLRFKPKNDLWGSVTSSYERCQQAKKNLVPINLYNELTKSLASVSDSFTKIRHKDMTPSVLESANFKSFSDRFEIVGTDGYKFVKTVLYHSQDSVPIMEANLPAASLKPIIQHTDKLLISPKTYYGVGEDYILEGMSFDGKYPDYNKPLMSFKYKERGEWASFTYSKTVLHDLEKFKKLISTLDDRFDSWSTGFDLESGRIFLGGGSVNLILPKPIIKLNKLDSISDITFFDIPGIIYFNLCYFIDILKAIDSDKFKIVLSENAALRPFWIEPMESESVAQEFALMPLKP